MFANKHFITALIVAPILALISYFAVDHMVKEKPQAAVEGQSYPLRAKSNCRYTSGECHLVNEDFKAKLKVASIEGTPSLVLETSHAVDAVNVGIANTGETLNNVSPNTMQVSNDTGKQWNMALPFETNETSTLAIAMNINGSSYFAETTMAFSEYKTLFKEDFRRE